MRQRLMVFGVMATGLALPTSASAAGAGTQDLIAIPAPATSVTQAADGSIWASLGARKTVVRIAPDGTQTESADLGGTTSGIAFGAGKVWVAVTNAKKVVAINPADPADTQVTPTPPGSCGPVAIAADFSGAYVSLPNDTTNSAACGSGTPSALMAISPAGVASAAVTGRGQAFDLAIASGKLFVPDNDGDVVRRVSLSTALTVDATYSAPGGPSGITVAPDGSLAVSLATTGVIATVPTVAPSGTVLTERATQVPSAFGLATVGSSLYAAGSGLSGGAPTIRRVLFDGATAPAITIPAGAQPFDVTAGPDTTAWFTDLANARLIRITSRAPRVTTGDLGPFPLIFPADPSTTNASLTVNPGGNATTVSIEYGTSPSYGSTASAGIAQGTTDQTLTAMLTGLQPVTRYFYRAVASSPEGVTYGAERTFVTIARQTVPPSAEPEPANPPKITLTRSTTSGLRVSKIRITGLGGGEKIAVTCTGAGCPSKKKDRTYGTSAKKAGSLTVKASKITAAKLRKGAKVTVVVSKQSATTVTATATATSTRKLTVKTRCRAVGATTSTAC